MKRKRMPPAPPPAPAKPDRRREPRRRGVPRWLTGRTDLDQVAQRRTLLILSVLSGHTPVTTAISEHGISRPLYYQLEMKGVVGMMRALAPGAGSTSPDDATPARQIADLEMKVTRLEMENRRLERLLLLAKRILPEGPVAFPERRGRKPGRRSTSGGPGPSPGSKRPATTTSSTTTSTQTPAGATAP